MKSFIGGQGPTLLAVEYTEAIIALVLVCLRGYAASKINGRWRWDFIWVVVGTVFGLAGLVAVHIAVLNGLGNQYKDLSYTQVFASLHWIWIVIFIGLPSVVFAKFSIIALLLSVQGPNAKKRAYALYFIGFINSAVCIIQIILSATSCTPISKIWEPILPGKCDSGKPATTFNYFQGTMGALTDVVLALWPISIVWTLQTSMKVKVGFCILMAIGMLPAIASIARMVLLPKISGNGNVTYDFADFMYWAVSELWAVIILGSIPPLRPLFLRVFYGMSSAVKSSSHGHSKVTTGAVLQSMTQSRVGKGTAQVTASQLPGVNHGGSDDDLLANDKQNMNIMVDRTYVIEETAEEAEAASAHSSELAEVEKVGHGQGSIV